MTDSIDRVIVSDVERAVGCKVPLDLSCQSSKLQSVFKKIILLLYLNYSYTCFYCIYVTCLVMYFIVFIC